MSLVIVYFSVILSYAIVIYWNAKNSNNSLNINRWCYSWITLRISARGYRTMLPCQFCFKTVSSHNFLYMYAQPMHTVEITRIAGWICDLLYNIRSNNYGYLNCNYCISFNSGSISSLYIYNWIYDNIVSLLSLSLSLYIYIIEFMTAKFPYCLSLYNWIYDSKVSLLSLSI